MEGAKRHWLSPHTSHSPFVLQLPCVSDWRLEDWPLPALTSCNCWLFLSCRDKSGS